MLRASSVTAVLGLIACFPASLVAQFENVQPDESKNATVLGTSQTSRYQVGVKVHAVGGPVGGLVASIPVPADWPEQNVRLADEEISPTVGRVGYRLVENTVKEMLVSIPRLQPGETAVALLTVEVERRSAKPPEDTTELRVPRRLPLQMRRYLGPSPFIESRHGEFRSKAREITEEIESDWARVEAIYDWVRDNITYTTTKRTNALTALREEKGDFEDVTGIFIALCRASDIPARTV